MEGNLSGGARDGVLENDQLLLRPVSTRASHTQAIGMTSIMNVLNILDVVDLVAVAGVFGSTASAIGYVCGSCPLKDWLPSAATEQISEIG